MPVKKIVWTMLFAVAMGMLECAVVVYLRELYYKDGFGFPLKTIPIAIARVEIWREVATIIMLIGVGILAGKNKLQRFAYFVFAFAIWDLFYYIFLYVFLGWPESLFTWDVLFLIPAPWVGPVWAPCLLCTLMITGSMYIIRKTEKEDAFKISPFYWGLMIVGALVCIISFMWDYLFWDQRTAWSLFSNQALFEDIKTYVPQQFNIGLFFTGFLMMLCSVILYIQKNKTIVKY